MILKFHDLRFRSALMTPATVRDKRSNYFLTSIISAGIFGTVYLIYAPTKDKNTRFFTIKEFPIDVNDRITDRARAEIKLLTRLSHVYSAQIHCTLTNTIQKHIVDYYDVIKATRPMLIIEYMPRGNLSN